MDLEFSITSKKEFLSMKLESLHPKDVLSVSQNTPLTEVIESLHKNNIGSILVMNEAKLIGVLSERDIINKLAEPTSRLENLNAMDAMTFNPRTLTTEDTFETAMKLMNQGGFRHVPVTDKEGNVVSVFSIKEALDFILMHL